jgi:hypothetical protein
MKYMTDRTAGTLIRLMFVDQPCTALEIGRASGLYPNGNPQTWAQLGQSLIYPLMRLGVAAKAGRSPMRYEITERGRIAVALFRAIANRKARERTSHEAA